MKDNTNFDQFSDINISSLSYLQEIGRLENPAISELARAMDVKKPSASAMVKKLVTGGYVEVFRSDEDRRVYRVKLSEKGIDFLAMTKTADDVFFDRIEDILEKSEFKEFSKLWEKISSNLCGD
ncbi:Transcriptional regulator, MarR family [Methanococcoides methylutens MM1]|uniref:Transcriptional regulator, MarR family n=1 Tax=Methanococcoides methylutens MM1 TaxID=1434104 RepID=A0A0E3SQS4_METMT|nr:Transcriptional regulator, MarR family [Methanococcoides methylutens MM1]